MGEIKSGQVEYHYGFYAAIRYDYEPARLSIEQEYELGEQPIRLDMLIVRRRGSRVLKDPVGRFFRDHNILEYKSPTDALSIDDFYKVQGYACIYKSLGRRVDAIPIEGMSVSIFRHAYPREMFAALRRRGCTVEEVSGGIYYVDGPLCVPAQVVVISRLEGYEELRILSPGASKEDVRQFIERTLQRPSDHVRAILRVSLAANRELYQELEEEGQMKDVFERVFHKELAEAKAAGRNEGWAAGRNEGALAMLILLVQDGLLSLRKGAARANMTEAEFRARMAQARGER